MDAYLARRALDYLVGFTLSPVLWRKLPGARSAGRVQSVALRLVVEREMEIEAFQPQEYWTVDADFAAVAGNFTARLTHLDGKKLDKLSLHNEAEAKRAVAGDQIAASSVSARSKPSRSSATPPRPSSPRRCSRRPRASSASRPSALCRLAQQLYEGVEIGGETVGLITYMRTDGVQMAGEAVAEARQVIGERLWRALRAVSPPRLYLKGQERAGSARSHSPNQLRAHAGQGGALSR